MVVKISDFGLSRDIYAADYYRMQTKSLVPLRWMPPESIFFGKFSAESDVWSYGVLLWEIVTCGERPYTGVATEALLDLIKVVMAIVYSNIAGLFFIRMATECPSRFSVLRTFTR